MSQIIFTGGGGVTPGSAVETLTADTGGAVSPTANNINIDGGENINTVGDPGSSTITINLNETIHWSTTNGAGTTGAIYLGATGGVGGQLFMHNYSPQGLDGDCTYLGNNAGNLTGTGFEAGNTGIGNYVMNVITSGIHNTGVGNSALAHLTSGSINQAFGDGCLQELTTGSNNVGIGFEGSLGVGNNYTVENDNIVLNNTGQPGDANVMRLGTDGTGDSQTNSTFIAGIFGRTVDADTGTAVFVDTNGQLGTVVSSRRFKKDIESITEEESESIMRLRPVSFKMISEKNMGRQIGLIAEEVQEHIPSMVIHDPEGKPFTVKYHELPILMLNELQKQNAIITSLVRRINLLEQAQGGYDEL